MKPKLVKLYPIVFFKKNGAFMSYISAVSHYYENERNINFCCLYCTYSYGYCITL